MRKSSIGFLIGSAGSEVYGQPSANFVGFDANALASSQRSTDGGPAFPVCELHCNINDKAALKATLETAEEHVIELVRLGFADLRSRRGVD